MVWRVTAIGIWALWASVYFIAWIPTTVTTVFQFGNFIRMPRTILGNVGLIGTWTEGDTLWIAMAICEDTLIETCWWFVVWCCFTVTINSQYLAAELRWALRASTIVIITNSYIQVSVSRAEANAAAIMCARATKWVVRFFWLVAKVINNFNKV